MTTKLNLLKQTDFTIVKSTRDVLHFMNRFISEAPELRREKLLFTVWEKLVLKWKIGTWQVEETTFLAALCAVQNSPEASLDQHETEVALNELQNFVSRFPNSELLDSCNVIMDKLRYKLETKEMMNVRLYSKTENYRAAVVSSEAFLDNYPRSKYREEAWAILMRNSYHLALNSVDSKMEDRIAKTNERFNVFLVEFPNSDYLREFEGYVEKLKKIDIPATNK